MRLAAAIVVFFGAYFAVVLLARRRSSVIRELDRRYFVRQTVINLAAFAVGTIASWAETPGDAPRTSWTGLVIEYAIMGAFWAVMMNAGSWISGRLLRWARTGR
jgi:hypothetical protein